MTLTAQKRDVIGRKVKTLRREGILPANIYGKKIKSHAVSVPLKEFLHIYEKAGETGLVDLKVDSEVRPVLITNVQLHPMSDMPLHADFRQVDLKEKVTATVPIELIGESPAEKSGIGILVQQLSEVEVEALPTNLPEKLVIDVSKLENIDDAVTVAQIAVDREKVALQVENEQIVAKIEPLAKEEVVAPPVEEVAAEGEEGAEAPAAEGEEAPPVEEKPTETPESEK